MTVRLRHARKRRYIRGAGRGTLPHMGNRESLKGYFAAITALDLNVGRILERLAELGIRENTLIVFSSDNGYSCGHNGFGTKATEHSR